MYGKPQTRRLGDLQSTKTTNSKLGGNFVLSYRFLISHCSIYPHLYRFSPLEAIIQTEIRYNKQSLNPMTTLQPIQGTKEVPPSSSHLEAHA